MIEKIDDTVGDQVGIPVPRLTAHEMKELYSTRVGRVRLTDFYRGIHIILCGNALNDIERCYRVNTLIDGGVDFTDAFWWQR